MAPGEDGESSFGEAAKRPAEDANQSTESIGAIQKQNEDSSQLKRPPSSSLSGYTESQSAPSATSGAASLTKDNNDSPAVFSALNEPITGNATADALDWYVYHRGRAGQEQRDEQTGELQYDLPAPTDTSHYADEPNLSNTKITVRFPLDDRDRRVDNITDGRKSMFRENIFWDWLGRNSVMVDGDSDESMQQMQSGLLEKTPMEIAGMALLIHIQILSRTNIGPSDIVCLPALNRAFNWIGKGGFP